MPQRTRRVIKLGGSLLNLPDLRRRLLLFLRSCGDEDLLWVVGGGRAADWVRQFDQLHQIGDEVGHWAAVRAMQLNSIMIARVIPAAELVGDSCAARDAWQQDRQPIVDPVVWLQADERGGEAIAHRWSFTSDSIAAHVAAKIGAAQLTLLKSRVPSTDCMVSRAVTLGVVDDDFEQAAASVPSIDLVNLRQGPRQSPIQPPVSPPFEPPFERCVLR